LGDTMARVAAALSPEETAARRTPPAAAPAASPSPVAALAGKDITIESVGPTDCSATELRIPIRLLHAVAGRIELCLRLSLGSRGED
jgi:hypothetical protein